MSDAIKLNRDLAEFISHAGGRRHLISKVEEVECGHPSDHRTACLTIFIERPLDHMNIIR
jgi:hypothetical protein